MIIMCRINIVVCQKCILLICDYSLIIVLNDMKYSNIYIASMLYLLLNKTDYKVNQLLFFIEPICLGQK